MNFRSDKLIIAIDGYSSCGKSTFAKAIARELSYLYIDSGAMYRAVTLFAIRNHFINGEKIKTGKLVGALDSINIDFKRNSNGKYETCLNGENIENEIREVKVSESVSNISTIKEVRLKLVHLQRNLAKNKGIVMDGRDIGTTVFPDADLKIFMTAEPEIRARRRFDELTAKGLHVEFREIMKNIEERDIKDSSRKISPLRKADDAIVLDNSYMTPEEQMVWFRELIKQLSG
ncbi:MAG: (d)CMP kinase [Bacteroidales bacterium]|nr:(d)CMP kinase [Bacteroidales bacterium]